MSLETSLARPDPVPCLTPTQQQLDAALRNVFFSDYDVVWGIHDATLWGSARVGEPLVGRPFQVFTVLTIRNDISDLTIWAVDPIREPGSTYRFTPFTAGLQTATGLLLGSTRDNLISPKNVSMAVIPLDDPRELIEARLILIS